MTNRIHLTVRYLSGKIIPTFTDFFPIIPKTLLPWYLFGILVIAHSAEGQKLKTILLNNEPYKQFLYKSSGQLLEIKLRYGSISYHTNPLFLDKSQESENFVSKNRFKITEYEKFEFNRQGFPLTYHYYKNFTDGGWHGNTTQISKSTSFQYDDAGYLRYSELSDNSSSGNYMGGYDQHTTKKSFYRIVNGNTTQDSIYTYQSTNGSVSISSTTVEYQFYDTLSKNEIDFFSFDHYGFYQKSNRYLVKRKITDGKDVTDYSYLLGDRGEIIKMTEKYFPGYGDTIVNIYTFCYNDACLHGLSTSDSRHKYNFTRNSINQEYTLEIVYPATVETIFVFSSSGNKIAEIKTSPSQTIYPLKFWSEGIYLIQVIGPGERYIKKMNVE